jgi:hypothetical protein
VACFFQLPRRKSNFFLSCLKAVIRTGLNATKVVPGHIYFHDAVFVSESVRAQIIAETPFATKHRLLTEDETERLIVGRWISDLLVGSRGMAERQLIVLIDGSYHLSVWSQFDGNLLQLDELDQVADADDKPYFHYFGGDLCDAWGRSITR